MGYLPTFDERGIERQNASTELTGERFFLLKSLAISPDERYKSARKDLSVFVGKLGCLGSFPRSGAATSQA